MTRSRTPSAPHAPRTNVVLPEPSSHPSLPTSPAASRPASLAPSASVSSGEVVVVPAIASKTTIPPMPAYVIVETDVHDPEQYERYKAASPGQFMRAAAVSSSAAASSPCSKATGIPPGS